MRKLLFSCVLIFSILPSIAQDTLTSVSDHRQTDGNRIGGHFGITQYIIKSASGENEIVGDDFYEIGFPAGITVFKEDFAFDIEMVPFIDKGSNVTFLFHPGVLFDLGSNFTFGTRGAFEIGKRQYGFTPLLRKSFICKRGQRTFIEAIFPVRFSSNGPMTNIAGLHLGVEF